MMSWRVTTPIGSSSSVTTIGVIGQREEFVRQFDLFALIQDGKRPAHDFADRLVQDVGMVEDRLHDARRR